MQRARIFLSQFLRKLIHDGLPVALALGRDRRELVADVLRERHLVLALAQLPRASSQRGLDGRADKAATALRSASQATPSSSSNRRLYSTPLAP